jgi:hypothetical protein
MWGISFIATNGLPMTWDAGLQSFSAPSPDRARDLKADALAMARDIASKMKDAA